MKKIILIGIAAVTLSSFAYAEDSAIDLEKIVITPARMCQYMNEVVSNVDVITSDDIAGSNALYVKDILEQKLGLNIYSNSTPKTVKVDIRGFADTSVSNVLVLIDGRKVNSIDMSGADWVQVPVETIERIEVIKGAGSVLYGDNAVGGVINIVTKKGRGDKASGSAGVKYGSYNLIKEDVELKGEFKKVSYYFHSDYSESDGYRDNSDLLVKDYNTRICFDATDVLSLDFAAGWHEDDYGMPGGLNDSELAQYGRRGSVDNRDFATTKDRYIRLSPDYKAELFGVDFGDIIIDLFYRNRDSYSWFYYGGFPTATKYMIDTKGVTLKHVYKGDLKGTRLNVVTGVDYYDVEHIIKQSEWGTDDLTIYKDELGVYSYLDYELFDKFFINTGGRYQTAEYTFDQRASSVNYVKREPRESVFMGGAKYEYRKNSFIHCSVHETFRFLATDEWYSTWTGLNTNIDHQTGIQYEAGIKHDFDNKAKIKLTPYLIDIKNEIYLNPSVWPGNNDNYDKTRRKGLEVGVEANIKDILEIDFLDKLSLSANYNYQEPKFKDGSFSGKYIPFVPKHSFNTVLEVGVFDGLNISASGRFIGDRYAINDTSNVASKVKNSFVCDTRLYFIKKYYEIYAGINNIFNEKYFDYAVKPTGAGTAKDYYPAPERNFEVGVKCKF
ncbi:MAG: TonB-dependent receptor [Candidatus Omnitrophota bacterium]